MLGGKANQFPTLTKPHQLHPPTFNHHFTDDPSLQTSHGDLQRCQTDTHSRYAAFGLISPSYHHLPTPTPSLFLGSLAVETMPHKTSILTTVQNSWVLWPHTIPHDNSNLIIDIQLITPIDSSNTVIPVEKHQFRYQHGVNAI